MEKNRRQAYLEALGIQQWVHRASQQRLLEEELLVRAAEGAVEALVPEVEAEVVVGGQSSSEVALSITPSTESPAESSAITSAPPAISPSPHSSSTSTSTSTSPSSASSPSTVPPAAPSAKSLSAPLVPTTDSGPLVDPGLAAPFASLYCQFDRGILVVAQLEDPYAPGFSAQEHALYHNILLALRWQPGAMQMLKWPLESQLLSNDQASMEIMLSSFLNAQVQRSGVSSLIVFGAQLEANFGRYFKDSAEPSITHLALPSLGELLRNPEQKAKVWDSLKPFRS